MRPWFGLVSLFNGISTFVGYLMPKPFSEKNSSGTIIGLYTPINYFGRYATCSHKDGGR